jgi:predicted DNA-binding transcriptional regulator AlpA
MSGRRPELKPESIRKIDEWMKPRPGQNHRRVVLTKEICARLKISPNTLYDAAHRRGGYRRFPRG